jgi:hypothetical protein
MSCVTLPVKSFDLSMDIVMLDLARAVSLALSIGSLYALLDSAFFVTATRWEERLVASIARVGLAACVCFASGMLFRRSADPAVPLMRTLPVRLFLWALLGITILFVVAWYLDVYYMPRFWRNQPH